MLFISAFGFVNGLVLRNHGPAFDLGIVAGVLRAGAFFAARQIRDEDKEPE